MEAVAPNAAIAHFARQGEQSRDVRLGLMEGSVETGNLRHPGKAASHDPDRLQVVRLMQRRERHQRLKRLEDGRRRPAPGRNRLRRHGRPGVRWPTSLRPS